MENKLTIFNQIFNKTRFDSVYEVEAFERKINELQLKGLIEEVKAEKPLHKNLEEHWYKEKETGQIYRYCPPEFPARGLWEKVCLND